MCVNISMAPGSLLCVDGDALAEKLAIKEVESEPEGDGRMKRSPYTAEQIIGILKKQEARTPVAELCRKHGMSDARYYNWKSKHGGLEVSEAKRLRTLETANANLKWLLANAMLDNAALQDLLGKKSRRPLLAASLFGRRCHETRQYRSVSVGRVDRLPVGPSPRLPSQPIDFGLTL